MKKRIVMVCLAFTAFFAVQAQNHPAKELKPTAMLRHVVMFQFNEKATAADIQKVVDAFKALPSQIPMIKGFEWGTNNSPEKLNQGLTHCFFLTFASAADRDAYLVHPAHKAFGALLGPYFGKATVFDYWVQH
ncbi:MAG: Dabb family protein [Bacteroidota bacterium]|nr:Dabb family protein [Bacteroidota bacterium]